MGELRNEVHGFFEHGRKLIQRAMGDCAVVFIFDQFAQIRDTLDSAWRKV